jgi:hypothetical protein
MGVGRAKISTGAESWRRTPTLTLPLTGGGNTNDQIARNHSDNVYNYMIYKEIL